jgi:division protein 1
MMFDNRRIVSAAGENVVKVYDKLDGRHWDCGSGVTAEEEGRNPAIVERVRIKDGYGFLFIFHSQDIPFGDDAHRMIF